MPLDLELDHLHDQATFHVENIVGSLIRRIWAAKTFKLCALLIIGSLSSHKWVHLKALLHELVELFDALHHMVAVEICSTLALGEAVADSLSDTHQ